MSTGWWSLWKGRILPWLFQLWVVARHPWGSLAYRCSQQCLCHPHVTFFLCVFLCPNLIFLKETSHGIRVHSNPAWIYLTLITSAKTLFPERPHSQNLSDYLRDTFNPIQSQNHFYCNIQISPQPFTLNSLMFECVWVIHIWVQFIQISMWIIFILGNSIFVFSLYIQCEL